MAMLRIAKQPRMKDLNEIAQFSNIDIKELIISTKENK
jgi:hypothetical protein